MKEKKKITFGTVIATSIGAVVWIVIAFCHRKILANTSTFALMIALAFSWSFVSAIRITQYLKQRKQAE